MKRMLGLALVAVLFLAGCSKPTLGTDTVAMVNGRPVTNQAFETRLKLYELFFRQPMTDAGVKQKVLNQMITDLVLRDQAEALQIKVEDAEVETEMARFFGSLDKVYQDRAAVNQRLQELGLTNDAVAGFMKDFLLSSAVSDRKKAEVDVTEAELQAFYVEKQATAYTFTEEVVRAAHVLVPLEEEVLALEIAAKAKAGGDFAELARLYSVDPGTALLGGELGYFTRSSMVTEFADAAFDMAPGRTSDPVKSQYGWHIILVQDRQGPGVLPYEKAREDARTKVLVEKQEKVYQQWVSQLEQAARVERAPLDGTK